jgi:hypothetical protein
VIIPPYVTAVLSVEAALKQSGKTLIHIVESAPMVERRSLAVYDSVASGGAR